MNIRPVKTDQDFDSALARIEVLWGAEPGTCEGDELEILLTLVTAYESENHPVPPPSQIEAIRFIMDQKGLTYDGCSLMRKMCRPSIRMGLKGDNPNIPGKYGK